MATIHEIVAEAEAAIRDSQEREQSLRNRIEDEIDAAKLEGRSNLSAAADARCEAMFADIEHLRSARGRLTARLERAREVEAEEREADKRLNTVTTLKRSGRTADIHVTRNERTYHKGNDPRGSQFISDVCRAQVGGDARAWERLNRHMEEEDRERAGYDFRAAGDLNTTGSGGIVVPQYLVDMTAPAVAARRPLADSCTPHQLPAEGMSIIIPTITTATSAALQTSQLSAVSATSMAETDLTIAVKTAAGSQNVSRQAADRSRVDEFVMSDLLARVATALDNELINGATTGLDAVAVGAAASTPTYDKIYPAILGRQAAIEAAILNGAVDLVVMHSRRWASLSAALTSTWPFISDPGQGPGEAGKIASHGYGSAARGVLPNGLMVVVDNNIATNKGSGTNEDVIYVVPSFEAHLWEANGAPVMIRAEQANAASLGILIVAFEYFAYTFSRYGSAMGKVTGLTPPTF